MVLKQKEFGSRMNRIEQSLEHMDSEDLLEEDRHFLEEYPLETMITWEESMETARSTAFFAQKVLEETECKNSEELQAPFFRPPPERNRRDQSQESN